MPCLAVLHCLPHTLRPDAVIATQPLPLRPSLRHSLRRICRIHLRPWELSSRHRVAVVAPSVVHITSSHRISNNNQFNQLSLPNQLKKTMEQTRTMKTTHSGTRHTPPPTLATSSPSRASSTSSNCEISTAIGKSRTQKAAQLASISVYSQRPKIKAAKMMPSAS